MNLLRQLYKHRVRISRDSTVVASSIPCHVRDTDVQLEPYDGDPGGSVQHVSEFRVRMPVGTDIHPADVMRFSTREGGALFGHVQDAVVQRIRQLATGLEVVCVSTEFAQRVSLSLYFKSLDNPMFFKSTENPMSYSAVG